MPPDDEPDPDEDPLSWEASPPFFAISRRFSSSIEANPRLLVSPLRDEFANCLSPSIN